MPLNLRAIIPPVQVVDAVQSGVIIGADTTANANAFNAAIQECVATGRRAILFRGAGAASGSSNYGFGGANITIPAMPPMHVGGPVEPLYLVGHGYGNTQLTNGNMTTLSPIYAVGLQFRNNFILEGPVAGPTTYPHKFRDCGFTDAGLFFKVNSRIFFDGCHFSLEGNGPVLSHLSTAGKRLWLHVSNCEISSTYIASGPVAYTVDELTVVGGTSGIIRPFTGLVDAQGTLVVGKVAACGGIANQ